jgi:hypothetical protein
MISSSHWIRSRRGIVFVALVSIVLLPGVACQTFSLSEEDFQKQQRGQMVDPETGNAVTATSTIGYYGAMLGGLIAAAVRK